LFDHFGDAGGVFDAVAVEEEEVGGTDDVFFWDGTTAVAGADEETVAVFFGLAHAGDEFVDASGFEDLVIVGFDVGLVVDFDEDIAPAAVEEPAGGFVGGFDDGGFVLELLILAEVEVA
jgi:hypothetical protein